MSYLLDTCIVSKLSKISLASNDVLKNWILSRPETEYFISVLTIGEIQFGISKLRSVEGRKKAALEAWLLADLIPRFKDRILPIDDHTATFWGMMRGRASQHGRLYPVIDALIAASALQHNLILVTENVKDFHDTGVIVINPLQRTNLTLDYSAVN